MDVVFLLLSKSNILSIYYKVRCCYLCKGVLSNYWTLIKDGVTCGYLAGALMSAKTANFLNSNTARQQVTTFLFRKQDR